MYLDYYFYYLYYTFLGYPFVIKVAVVCLTVFIPVIVYNLVKLFFTKSRYFKRKKLKEKDKEAYEERLKAVLTSKTNYSRKDISIYLHGEVSRLQKLEKRVLTNLLFNIYKKNIEHVNEHNYKEVVDYLGLRKYWENKLKSRNSAVQLNALRKLDDFNLEIPGSIITRFTYNRSSYLRKRARVSHMLFSKNNPFKFFDEDFDRSFNEWDKIDIHRVLVRRSKEGLPNLTQWIKHSQNVNFKCFLVDEIKYFKQYESAPFLLELIDNTLDINLRKHCIEVIGDLDYKNAEDILMKDYNLQPVILQNSIIKTIEKLKTGRALPFLKNAYYNSHNVESKLIILKAIFNYGDEGSRLFFNMKERESPFSKLIFEHVGNPLIKYI